MKLQSTGMARELSTGIRASNSRNFGSAVSYASKSSWLVDIERFPGMSSNRGACVAGANAVNRTLLKPTPLNIYLCFPGE
jgi:hypothetical protein